MNEMDKYGEMSPGLRKAAIALLERASEEFSNHGCNDFDLREEAELTEAETLDVLRQLHEFNNDPNDPDPDPAPKRGDTMTTDWLVMNLVAAVLRNE